VGLARKLSRALMAIGDRGRSGALAPRGPAVAARTVPAPDGERIVVAYEPDIDGAPDPGEVVWAWVSFEDDPAEGKDRPVVVIGRWGAALAGVPLSSRDRPGDPDRVPVGAGKWDAQRRPSYADVGRVLRLPPASVRREGAALDRRAFDRVIDRLEQRG